MAYAGDLAALEAAPTRTWLPTWADLGAEAAFDGLMDAPATWIALAAANADGESSAGRTSFGSERRARIGWPGGGSCP